MNGIFLLLIQLKEIAEKKEKTRKLLRAISQSHRKELKQRLMFGDQRNNVPA